VLIIGTAVDAPEEINEKVSKFSELMDGMVDKVFDFGLNLLIAVIIFLIGKVVLKILRKILKDIFQRSNVDVGVVRFIDSIVKVLGYVIILIVICSQIGIQTTSFITLLGTAGVSVGLALQGSLSNFAGGVLILIAKPFVVGDYIAVEGTEGTVQKIDIIYTRLNTVDNKVITLPNGNLANSVVTNYTKEKIRRVDLSVGIHYEDSVDQALKIATEVMSGCEFLKKEKDNQVVVRELAEHSVTLQIRMWVDTDDYWPAYFSMNQKVKEEFEKNGIRIPYNQLDVHVVGK
jgi:small conductance mechanosensitive channel